MRALWIRCVLALIPLLGAAFPAAASHVTVRADRTGDFATIDDAVQTMMYAHVADTLIVEPGYYDETVNDSNYLGCVIYAPAGPESTVVRAFISQPESPYYDYAYGKVVGLQIRDKVAWGRNTLWMLWENCIFGKGYEGVTNYGAGPPVKRCTFRGESSFIGFGRDLVDCRFENAPVYLENVIGYLRPYRCTFTGSATYLARVWPRDNSNIYFEECTFSDATTGVTLVPIPYYDQLLDFVHCRFERISGAAVEFKYGVPEVPERGMLAVTLRGNVFADVARGIQCLTSIPIKLTSQGDTLLRIHENAIEATVRRAYVTGLFARDVGGAGLLLINQNAWATPMRYWPNEISIAGGHIERCGGDGILVTQLSNPDWDPQLVEVKETDAGFCAGEGVELHGTAPRMSGCLLRGNDGDGARIVAERSAPSCSLRSNTAVANAGGGIVVRSATPLFQADIQRNLVTQNGLAGLDLDAAYSGVVTANDSWENGGPAYRGVLPGDGNLERDPLYCMPSAGDYEVRSNSPCGPDGPFGSIGARGVGCVETTDLAALDGDGFGLRVTPNPARWGASFTWKRGGPASRLSIYDLQGRMVWTAPPWETTAGGVRWNGRGASGARVRPGVYVVRWTRGAERATTRLVVLDP